MNAPKETGLELAKSAWCVIGGGNMASAIVLGALEAGAMQPGQWTVVEIDAPKRKFFSDRGVRAVESVAEGIAALKPVHADSRHLLLAVKPQSLGLVASQVASALDGLQASCRVVSILAGTPTTKLEGLLGTQARVLRAMPNMPARIRRGTTALACGSSCKPGDDRETSALFRVLGTVIPLEETLFDAFTAIAGSGPAYLFYVAEALARAGIEQGFTPEQADAMVRSMLGGSTDLLEREKGESAATLRASVTSKGGTTAAAIDVLDQANVMAVLSNAIKAATDRGRSLSQS